MAARIMISVVTLSSIACLAWAQNGVAVKEGNDKAPALETLKWLAGRWEGDVEGDITEEHWTEPGGGMLLGMNRSVYRSGKASFEFLRIAETPNGITYFASPSGKAATPFILKDASDGHVVFENKENDFPQRIIYRRQKDSLNARIEGVVKGKEESMEWTWKLLP